MGKRWLRCLAIVVLATGVAAGIARSDWHRSIEDGYYDWWHVLAGARLAHCKTAVHQPHNAAALPRHKARMRATTPRTKPTAPDSVGVRRGAAPNANCPRVCRAGQPAHSQTLGWETATTLAACCLDSTDDCVGGCRRFHTWRRTAAIGARRVMRMQC